MSSSAESWRRTWQELGAAAADEGLYRQLLACWSEPHRHYHTLAHLDECLAQLDAAHDLARRPAEVAVALWFHDAVYEPRRTDNETRSAEWARSSVIDAQLPAQAAGRVHALVMATEHGKEQPPQDADLRLMTDIDLAILGAEAARFDEYGQQIRAEYAHVPEEQFREGRRQMLEGFLARPRIYLTEHFHSALENRARENLRRALVRPAAR